MHREQSPKTLNFQQQKKQSKSCEAYKQSYNVRPKYDLKNRLKTTTGLTKEKMSEFKTNKLEKSSSNWKPLHSDWDATTSNFLEDGASDDDSIFIVDSGWDDYCLKALKLYRPEMQDACGARM
ncbi:hypothetical protein Tco_1294661 [Tanacetum coccineum]